ncbi:MAG TPA: hypothetical protein VMZ52_04495, partial [Bryobacteraceae bacterium]|nr:hypothetical protein [Bryobacteraceae bacterium]
MLFSAVPPPPVSYGRQIASIFALHCNGCHGDSGGLSTRSYADLMKGGNLGKVVVTGDPERSLLVHFLDGRRGEAHRMPQGGRSLSAEQIGIIRRWIAEGAKQDSAAPPKYSVRIKGKFGSDKAMRIFCRVHTESYLILTVRHPATRTTLLTEVASLKSPKQAGDAGEPGELIWWDIHAG